MSRWAVLAGGVSWIGVLMNLTVQAADFRIQHHDLRIDLQPETHTIMAQDTIRLVASPAADQPNQIVHVQLHPSLEIEEVLVDKEPVRFWEGTSDSGKTDQAPSASRLSRTIAIQLPQALNPGEAMSVQVAYRGNIHDAPTASPGLRFVRPDKTLGYIGKEGVYLTSETSWYPNIMGSLASFRVRVTVPKGWRAVTHGREISFETRESTAESEWQVRAKTEALTLAANRFVKQATQWKGIEVATYLFPEDAHLSDQYLTATAHYLDWYTKLLGPYPFPKFAVVENFFPSGIGLPSFTLLGSRVIKRGYTQPYSLGHEIVHSWVGNSVHNHFETGNWVEGLTTYLANYYYDEQSEGDEKARAHRRRMIMEYNIYVQPADDYPVVKFHHKETRLDNAIGYQKTAMIFHMLREYIGTQDFFAAIRTLVADYTGRYADWPQVQQTFEDTSGKDLSWFFDQWIHRGGLPHLRIVRAHVEPDAPTGYRVVVRVTQQGTPYRLRVPVVIQLEQGQEHRALLDIREQAQTMALRVSAKPRRLRLDPEYRIFRRLPRQAMSPMLNLWVTDQRRAVLVASTMSETERQGLKPAIDRIRSQDDDTIWLDEQTSSIGAQSVLAMGHPQTNPWSARILQWCGPQVTLNDRSITIQGTTYQGDGVAVLVNCAHPEYPERVGTVFFGLSSRAIHGLSRLLFFYGWDSYLVFENRRVMARGSFDPPTADLTVELQAVDLRGFVPARRGPFVSTKGPKTISARAWPGGFLRPSTESSWLRNSLRSDSPRRPVGFGAGTQPRPRLVNNCGFYALKKKGRIEP